MSRLKDKYAIVTGAAQGQGAAIARAFVAEGARVALADIADEAGEALAADLGDAAHFSHHDVSDAQSWQRVVAEAEERFGTPANVLVNNAGILRFGEVDTMPMDEFDLLVAVNMRGCFLGMQAVAPGMKAGRQGSIINCSSVEGLAGMSSLAAYTGTKFAIRGMTKAAAVELGAFNIRVNSVHPGMVDTPMTRVHGGDAAMEWAATRIPLERVGTPEDIAPLYVHLAGDESSYTTGGEFAIDGGATATHSFYPGNSGRGGR
ncbi:oxidoreductase, short chain dehydrogenase/reductase family protein [Aeromicrobium marinum DSM 15272]|uniref:Oxidoreductase, short chain dehydrogenase/reductase family protein n=1 Tax=Aeromicrobium marinum DSM 15272 TaxID=585531 RepID=E2SEJ0_9ACTN|nr:glucose 1-dehydrogenase [Aeromicrobium marinum]EFQ82287.1 oxidoreductase, short chain dehydrogenase/reductase family protein [Aeromicrobium marinum DSM 15272]